MSKFLEITTLTPSVRGGFFLKWYEEIEVPTREDLPNKPPKWWQREATNGYKRIREDAGLRPTVEFEANVLGNRLVYITTKWYY